jgi:protein SCO1/2
MSKNALLALSIAVLIPLISYVLVKDAGESAMIMPRRFFVDSVITKTVSGKLETDTVWHRTEDFTLINQLGDTVHLSDIKGKVIVADFFFTHCPSICPTLTKNMARLQQSFIRGGDPMQKIDTSVVQFLSFSIDPERDSVPVLKAYADKFGVNDDNWWLLTGPKKTIYDLALNEFKLGLVDGEGIDTAFVHTQKFVLLDRDHVVRGMRGFQSYYDGLDTASIAQLAHDIGLLMMEKESEPDHLPFDPVLMGVLFAISVVVVLVVMGFIFKKKKNIQI